MLFGMLWLILVMMSNNVNIIHTIVLDFNDQRKQVQQFRTAAYDIRTYKALYKISSVQSNIANHRPGPRPHSKPLKHDDIIKWKYCPRYWPFMRGIHRSRVNSPQKRPVTRSFDVFFDLRPKQQWWGDLLLNVIRKMVATLPVTIWPTLSKSV